MTKTWEWARDGQRRLYVVGDDNVTLGYLDLATGLPGEVHPQRAEEFYTALAAWRARNGLEREYTAEELHGVVCVDCGTDYRLEARPAVAVPTFEPGTLTRSARWQLVACLGDCAVRQSGEPQGMTPHVEPAPLAERLAAYLSTTS